MIIDETEKDLVKVDGDMPLGFWEHSNGDRWHVFVDPRHDYLEKAEDIEDE